MAIGHSGLTDMYSRTLAELFQNSYNRRKSESAKLLLTKLLCFCKYSCEEINGSKLDQTADTRRLFLRVKVNINTTVTYVTLSDTLFQFPVPAQK